MGQESSPPPFIAIKETGISAGQLFGLLFQRLCELWRGLDIDSEVMFQSAEVAIAESFNKLHAQGRGQFLKEPQKRDRIVHEFRVVLGAIFHKSLLALCMVQT